MNTSKLLGLAALTVGIGGIAYLLSAPKDSVAAVDPPAPPALPPGEAIPSAPRLTRSKRPSPQRAELRAARVRLQAERAQARRALANRLQAARR